MGAPQSNQRASGSVFGRVGSGRGLDRLEK